MMTTPLVLDSLEIKQFRSFRHLQIERLGRVNLIVGKNNVGKSCLLEAFRLYARRGSPLLIWELLTARDESSRPTFIRDATEAQDQLLAIKYLFYGREDVRKNLKTIHIGPINSPANTLSIVAGWYTEIEEENRLRLQPLLPSAKYNTVDNPILGLAIQIGRQTEKIYRLDRYISRTQRLLEQAGLLCVFTSANGLDTKQIGELWDSVALTNLEEDVLASLRLIESEVERINLVSNPERSRERIPIVKIAGLDDPIPLRSLGEGMNRLFGIALALANAQGGLLLIDEVESGLHYSVQPDLWRLIFEMAHRLNVQVFATSHSWDCIEAFQEAAQEDEQEQGMLISLRRKQGKEDEIVAVLFDEQELATITREQIEVR
jgi:energy-coupling factor transporter ATP-binding protein EcfA2